MVTLTLTAVMAFLLGLTSVSRREAEPTNAPPSVNERTPAKPDPAAPHPIAETPAPAIKRPVAGAPGLVNFADVAERLNPAVVNIEATTRAGSRRRRPAEPSPFDDANPAPLGPSPARPQSG